MSVRDLRPTHVVIALAALVATSLPVAAGAGEPTAIPAAVPVPTIEYRFDGDLNDTRNASTMTPVPDCPVVGFNPCNSVTSFGEDPEGTYWAWETESRAGGGLRLTSNAPVGSTYTMSLKFSLASVAAGTTGYTKIVDYRDRAIDDGFYFHFGKLRYYPGGDTSTQTYANNTVVDLVTVRQATTEPAGTFTVYMVGPDKKLTELFVYNDTSGSSIPSSSGAGSLFGLFFDDTRTSRQAEGSPAGRVYSVKLWSNQALTPAELEESVLPTTAPTNATAVGGDTTATISWEAVDGASSYTATAEPGGATCTVAAPATTCQLTGLTNGTTYAVTVVASNANGASVPSGPVDVLPATTPDAPTDLVPTLGDGEVTIAFTPGSDGGSAITNYEYSLDGGGTWTALVPAAPSGPVTIGGLSAGETYEIVLRAVNAIGASGASEPVEVTLSPNVPDAPTDLVATPGDESTIIAFTIGNDNGSPITDHEVSVDDGPWRPVSPPTSGSPVVVDGLANGETYGIRLRSVNGVGPGLPSDRVRVTPAAAPTPTPTPTTAPTPTPTLTTVPGPSGGSSGLLPSTGADVGGLTGVGALLVALGIALGALRRRSASVHL